MPDNSYEGLQKRNLSKELESMLSKLDEAHGNPPRLLLHSCCAPCSSYVIEYLSRYFEITVFYYNPNISERTEYERRVAEQKRFIEEFPAVNKVGYVEGAYDTAAFYEAVKGYEDCREGGERCFRCYRLRLETAAAYASRAGVYDYFTTTLSISPHKNSAKLAQIGYELGVKYGVEYLMSDFKKKEGYKRSVQLSAEYGLYRQDYCGCVFSKRERSKQLG